MPKIKMPRSSPRLDMAPMVDMAFLLVTFFILTAKFRPSEPVEVVTPASISKKLLPENVMLITIDNSGRVFFNITGQEIRKNLLGRVGEKYGLKFNEDEVKRFGLMQSYGGDAKLLKQYLDMNESERGKFDKQSTGIPIDSTNNQLGDWILYGYNAAITEEKEKGVTKDKQLRIAIKADSKAPYNKAVKRVVEIFGEKNLYRFNLITNLKGTGEAPAS